MVAESRCSSRSSNVQAPAACQRFPRCHDGLCFLFVFLASKLCFEVEFQWFSAVVRFVWCCAAARHSVIFVVRLCAATGIFLLSSAVVHCFAIFVVRLCAAAEIFLLFSAVAHSFDIFIVEIYATVYILSLVRRCLCSLRVSSPAPLQAIATSSPLASASHRQHFLLLHQQQL